jgi:hypothetical protein
MEWWQWRKFQGHPLGISCSHFPTHDRWDLLITLRWVDILPAQAMCFLNFWWCREWVEDMGLLVVVQAAMHLFSNIAILFPTSPSYCSSTRLCLRSLFASRSILWSLPGPSFLEALLMVHHKVHPVHLQVCRAALQEAIPVLQRVRLAHLRVLLVHPQPLHRMVNIAILFSNIPSYSPASPSYGPARSSLFSNRVRLLNFLGPSPLQRLRHSWLEFPVHQRAFLFTNQVVLLMASASCSPASAVMWPSRVMLALWLLVLLITSPSLKAYHPTPRPVRLIVPSSPGGSSSEDQEEKKRREKEAAIKERKGNRWIND